jgi:hypothetical protein
MSDVTPHVIPADVVQFITERIGCVAELEAVLILRQNPEMKWSSQTLASRLYVPVATAEELLQLLCQSGFAAGEVDQPPLYRYQPATTDLQGKIDRLAALYSTHLVPVTRFIHAKARQRVQGFADAFKFRKDD